MSIIETIRWHVCWSLTIVISVQLICIFIRNLTESQRKQLINIIFNKKSSPTTSPTATPSSVPRTPPPPQFTLGMDVNEWTNTFRFYIAENNIEKTKRNELLLSKLEPFCQSVICDHLFDEKDQDTAFEQHILLMNKLFQLKKAKQQQNNNSNIKVKRFNSANDTSNSGGNNKNMRDLIPGLSLPNLVKCV